MKQEIYVVKKKKLAKKVVPCIHNAVIAFLRHCHIVISLKNITNELFGR